MRRPYLFGVCDFWSSAAPSATSDHLGCVSDDERESGEGRAVAEPAPSGSSCEGRKLLGERGTLFGDAGAPWPVALKRGLPVGLPDGERPASPPMAA